MNWVRIGGFFALVGVALGAFGAHGLKNVLVAHDSLEIWKTASFYHLVHAVAMVVPGMGRGKCSPALCFAAGIFIFSGSLYLLAVTGMTWLGMITPIGGVAFLLGWLLLALRGQQD